MNTLKVLIDLFSPAIVIQLRALLRLCFYLKYMTLRAPRLLHTQMLGHANHSVPLLGRFKGQKRLRLQVSVSQPFFGICNSAHIAVHV